jgi:hypothetical protein
MSHWYECISFDGERKDIATNLDGGPCGTPQALPAGPH